MKLKPTGPYVYQPYGTAGNMNLDAPTRIYGVGGVGLGCRIDGLHREEADAIVKALESLKQPAVSSGSAK